MDIIDRVALNKLKNEVIGKKCICPFCGEEKDGGTICQCEINCNEDEDWDCGDR